MYICLCMFVYVYIQICMHIYLFLFTPILPLIVQSPAFSMSTRDKGTAGIQSKRTETTVST